MSIKQHLRADVEFMINDDPISFIVRRDKIINKASGKKVKVEEGPFDGTIAEFKVARAYPAIQEPGTVTEHPFHLLALDIPIGTFILDCEVQVGNRTYRVTDLVSENDEDGITEIALNQVSS